MEPLAIKESRQARHSKAVLRRNGVSQQSVEVPEYFANKLFWIRILGAVLLVVLSPLILICMLLVKLTSRGPAVYSQRRVGKDGKQFQIYKIRTMYLGAEKITGAILCKPGDSRITPIGRLLRFLHLDELPQLVNVARGEMCLVGPRPERPEIIARHRLDELVPGFTERTKVLPGVTGIAQINLPADQTAECVFPKVALDLHYIKTATIGLDLRILLCTVLRMFGVRHGRAVKLFHLARKVDTLGPQKRTVSVIDYPGQDSAFGSHYRQDAGTGAHVYSTDEGESESMAAVLCATEDMEPEDGEVEYGSEDIRLSDIRRPR